MNLILMKTISAFLFFVIWIRRWRKIGYAKPILKNNYDDKIIQDCSPLALVS